MSTSVDPGRTEWDVIVVGGAAAGEVAAQYATQFSGLSAVIVEKDLVGGECSYWACMPSKALLRPVEVRSIARDLSGVTAQAPVDPAAVLARRDVVVNHLDDASQVRWARGAGIDVVRGTGRLDGARTVVVTGPDGGERRLTARHAVVLDTGSTPFVPPVPGLREAQPWTSRDATNLHEVPARVVVVGGGVVACEAATWLRGLGVAEVTVVHRGTRLLARNEPFVGELVAAALRAAGVDVRLRTSPESVRRDRVDDTGAGRVHGGEVTVVLSDGDTVVADEIVVATGRTPSTDGTGLETVGLRLDPGAPVPVDDHMTVAGVAGGWLYAVGDVTGRALLTHMGKYQARIAGAVIADRSAGLPVDGGPYSLHTDVADDGFVPQVIFTDPEVGAVGLTEAEARGRGLDIDVVEYDLAQLAGTYVLRENYVGCAKLVIDRTSDVVVGATFVGTGVAELTHSATMAVVGRIPVPVLWHVVPSYPTVSEAWLRLLENLDAARRSR